MDIEGVGVYLEHVLRSPRFRRAPSLAHLLRYVVSQSASDNSASLRESVIGIEVFGRPSDFDCRIDTIVRVQAHRLRKMLEAYYAEEGRGDPYRIVLPKGSYAPKVLPGPGLEQRRAEENAPPADLPPGPTVDGGVILRHAQDDSREETKQERTAVTSQGNTLAVPGATEAAKATPALSMPMPASATFGRWSLLLSAFCSGGLTVYLFAVTSGIHALGTPTAIVQPASESLRHGRLAMLWGPFLDAAKKSVIVYTNPVFLRNETHRLYIPYEGPINAPAGARLNPALSEVGLGSKLVNQPWFFSDGWTGTGEVLAVSKLTRMFTEAGSTLEPRRSRILTYDELRNKNAIFVGSAWGNVILKQIPLEGRRPFHESAILSNQVIFNVSPGPGEAGKYEQERDPKTREIVTSYCLFSVLPGVSPGTKIIASAGMSTHASWGAINMLSTNEGIAALAKKLQSGNSLPQYFQAVVKTNVVNGEATENRIVAARRFDPPAH